MEQAQYTYLLNRIEKLVEIIEELDKRLYAVECDLSVMDRPTAPKKYRFY